jgi:DNA invertase Pin-like site-specific DNA recombinase
VLIPLFGYARVSGFEQHLDLQEDALSAEGCERIFVEKASGAREARPELEQALRFARSGALWWSGSSTVWGGRSNT